ncbi:MAG: class I SAM-dependent methyltransferase [Gaiellales bacterium]
MEASREPTAPEYYDRRAPEYDDWYLGTGLFAGRTRAGFARELDDVVATLAALEPAVTLDIACGTAFLTRHLRGEVTGLDQSGRMLEIARETLPRAAFVQGDGLSLPFPDGRFERIVSGHFYGHLDVHQRMRFLAETRRVGGELVLIDASVVGPGVAEEWSTRTLNDGTEWVVYKRRFTAEGLLEEIGGGETLYVGSWFLVVRRP